MSRKKKIQKKADPSVLKMRIEDADIPRRLINALKRLDVSFVSDLLIISEFDVMRLRNVGRHTIFQLDLFMKYNNLK